MANRREYPALEVVADWLLADFATRLKAANQAAVADQEVWNGREDFFRETDCLLDLELRDRLEDDDDDKFASLYTGGDGRWFMTGIYRPPRTPLVRLQETETELSGETYYPVHVLAVGRSPEHTEWDTGDILNLCLVLGKRAGLKDAQRKRYRLWTDSCVTQDNVMEYLWTYYAQTEEEYGTMDRMGVITRALRWTNNACVNDVLVEAVDVLTHIPSLELVNMRFSPNVNALQYLLDDGPGPLCEEDAMFKATKHILDMPGGVDLLKKPVLPWRTYAIENWLPLARAAILGFTKVVKLLLDYGVDINDAHKGYTALDSTYGLANEVAMVKLFLDRGANWHGKGPAALELASQDSRALIYKAEKARKGTLTADGSPDAIVELYRYPPLFGGEPGNLDILWFPSWHGYDMVNDAIHHRHHEHVAILLKHFLPTNQKLRDCDWHINGPRAARWKDTFDRVNDFAMEHGYEDLKTFLLKSQWWVVSENVDWVVSEDKAAGAAPPKSEDHPPLRF